MTRMGDATESREEGIGEVVAMDTGTPSDDQKANCVISYGRVYAPSIRDECPPT